MSPGKKIVVTGGAGFIGSELVRQIAETNATVCAIDNFVNGKRENLVGLPSNVRVFDADIRDSARIEEIFSGAAIVFHLACLGVRHSIHAPRENHDVNATATLDLLQIARSRGVGRFIYTSSSEVYGTAKQVPMTEEHPTWPKTVYGGSKLAGESYTRAFHEVHGYPTVVVRPFNSFGPRSHHEGDCGEVIPKFMLRAMAGLPMIVFGDGMQTRDFTFVADTARGILAAGTSDEAIGETINLGSGRELTIIALAREICRVVGSVVPVQHDAPRPGDVLRLYSDSEKAKRLLGFEPRVSFSEGLKALFNWYGGQNVSPDRLLEAEAVRNWIPGGGSQAAR